MMPIAAVKPICGVSSPHVVLGPRWKQPEGLAPSEQQTSPPAVADALSLIGHRSGGHVSCI